MPRDSLAAVCFVLMIASTNSNKIIRRRRRDEEQQRRRAQTLSCNPDQGSGCTDGTECVCTATGRRLFGAPTAAPQQTCACLAPPPSPSPTPPVPPSPSPASPPPVCVGSGGNHGGWHECNSAVLAATGSCMVCTGYYGSGASHCEGTGRDGHGWCGMDQPPGTDDSHCCASAGTSCTCYKSGSSSWGPCAAICDSVPGFNN